MKTCTKCGETKDFSEFKKEKRSKTGYAALCKSCAAASSNAYYHNNKEKCRHAQNKYREENIDRIRQVNREYASRNKEKINQRAQNWQKLNPDKANARNAKRRALKRQAFLQWITKEELTRIKCFYQLAQMRSRESDVVWHVDHIVPLKGKLVCGLHVPWNLQVIPAHENLSKNNYFEVH